MTFTAEVNPIVDRVLSLVSVPNGWTKSATASPPPKFEPNVLYGFPSRPQQPRPVGLDFGDQSDILFFVRLAWSLGTNEEQGQTRKRSSADNLDVRLAGIVTAVQDNRANDLWEWIQVDAADPGAATTFDERVAAADLSGWRIV